MQVFNLNTTDWSMEEPFTARVRPIGRFVAFDANAGAGQLFVRNLHPEDAIALGKALVEAGEECKQRPVKLTVTIPANAVDSVREYIEVYKGGSVS